MTNINKTITVQALQGDKDIYPMLSVTVISPKPPLMGSDDKNDGDDDSGGTGTGLLTRPETKTKKPSMYKVLMLNDDYTPMEFVIEVLQSFFRLSSEKATEVMLHVHHRGVGICGVYPLDIAETKVSQVMSYARQNQHPLQCTLEKE